MAIIQFGGAIAQGESTLVQLSIADLVSALPPESHLSDPSSWSRVKCLVKSDKQKYVLIFKGSFLTNPYTRLSASETVLPDTFKTISFKIFDKDGGSESVVLDQSSPTYATDYEFPISSSLPDPIFKATFNSVAGGESVRFDLNGSTDNFYISNDGGASYGNVVAGASFSTFNLEAGDTHIWIDTTQTEGGVYNKLNITEGKSNLVSVESLGACGWTNLTDAFSNCSNLISVAGGDTSAVTGMISMFYNSSNVETVDVKTWDTSAVNNMSNMFYNAASLTGLDLSNFTTSAVTNMASMFYNAESLTELDLSSFDTSSVTNMSYMFREMAGIASLDLSSFRTVGVTTMDYMFYMDSALSSLDLSGWDFSNNPTTVSMLNFASSPLAVTVNEQVDKDFIDALGYGTDVVVTVVP